jgi:hypothetical protein
MNKLDELYKKLKGYRDALEKATLDAKSVPSISDSADMGEERDKKMLEEAHMNGTNTEQYNHKGEKVVHDRVPKKVADLKKKAPEGVDSDKHERCVMDVKGKGHDVGSAHAICTSSMKKDEGEPDMASPEKPKGLENKRKPVTHDECGRPFAKDELDEKIKAKMKAEMDKRKFGEADATRHIIDRDRGDKIAEKPKEKPLLQTEMIKFDDNGQWSIEKSNYGPKGYGLYNQADNAKRKAKNTGESFSDIGQNKNAKKYTTSGSSMQQAHEKAQLKEQKAKSKASLRTLADMSPEEKAELEAKYNTKVKA